MYLDFYGLKELPFALTPDPRFIYFTPSHREAMANLQYGIESGKGLIVVTGEVGTGKTTILRRMMQRFERTVLVAYIFNPRMSVPEFFDHIAKLLDVQEWGNKSDLLLALGETLSSRHERGLRTVLIIDEAHGLSLDVLEEIRLLSNFESATAKYMQIVLTGQPELRDVMNQPGLRQLKQRVALRCGIHPLPDVAETERYIAYRLLQAGAERLDLFSPSAIDLIFRCSEGIPRQINNLCDNGLLAGYGLEAQTITRGIIEEAAETLDMLPRNVTYVRGENEPAEAMTAPVFTSQARTEMWTTAATTTAAATTAVVAAAAPTTENEGTVASATHTSNGVVALHDEDQQAVIEEEEMPGEEAIGAAFRSWNRTGD